MNTVRGLKLKPAVETTFITCLKLCRCCNIKTCAKNLLKFQKNAETFILIITSAV